MNPANAPAPPSDVRLLIGNAQQTVMLPPVGEYATARLIVRNLTQLPGKVVAAKTSNALAPYLDLSPLVGQPILTSADTTFDVHVSYPKDKPLREPIRGQLGIRVAWNELQGQVYDAVDEVMIEPFPDFHGLFVLDYGNNSTTCVMLPPGVERNDPEGRFRALNFDKPTGPEVSHSSAVLIRGFVPPSEQGKQLAGPKDDVSKWQVEVGDTVFLEFQQVLNDSNIFAQEQARAFIPGGVKRYMGRQDRIPTASLTDSKGPWVVADKINGRVIKKFVNNSELCREAGAKVYGRVNRVVATRPVNFTPVQIRKIVEHISTYLDVPEDRIITRYDEATAAAIWFLTEQFHGKIHEFWAKTEQPLDVPEGAKERTNRFTMLVFDCGGGTTDIALVRVEVVRQHRASIDGSLRTDNWFEIRPTVAGLTGMRDFAGDNITLAALKLLRFKLAEAIARSPHAVAPAWQADLDKARFAGGRDTLKAQLDEQQKRKDGSPGLLDWEFAKGVEMYAQQVVPTDYGRFEDRPTGHEAQLRYKYFFQVFRLADWLKCELADKGSCHLPLRDLSLLKDYKIQAPAGEPAGGAAYESLADDPAFETLPFTRAELDERVRDEVRTAWERARDLCMDYEGEQVQQIVLAGNGAKYPLIEEVMLEVFGDGKFFRYRPHRVRRPGKDAKLSVAKGAATAEWYRQRLPQDFSVADQEVVGFRIDAKQVLPYSLYLEQGGKKLQALKRGEKFWDKDTGENLKEVRSIPYDATEVITIHQGLRDHRKPEETVAYCQFDLTKQLTAKGMPSGVPAGVPPEARRTVELCVDREYVVSGLIRWLVGAEVKHELRLEPEAIPPAPQEREKEPFSGMH